MRFEWRLSGWGICWKTKNKMYAVVTIAIEMSTVGPVNLPVPGNPARAAIEMLEMLAIQIGKEGGSAYMRVVETVIKEKQ